MKTTQNLKFLLLVVPFNALAHPGHEDTVLQAGASGLTANLFWIALTAALVPGFVFIANVYTRQKDNIIDD